MGGQKRAASPSDYGYQYQGYQERQGSSSGSTPAVNKSALAYPEAGPAPKKTRKEYDDNGEEIVPEKRQFVFKRNCPKNIEERVDRVLSQRFFCVKRERKGDTCEDFQVLGSTGNVYTVTIDKVPQCTCPDSIKGNHCKHILFVLLKILRVPTISNLYYQKAFLQSELSAIFALAPRDHADPTTELMRKVYKVATGEAGSEAEGSQRVKAKKRLPEEGDSCPVKCVFCRASWTDPVAAPPAQATYSEGYLNLGGAAGISPVRDTSSYYNGPRRGNEWGWGGGYGYGGGFGGGFDYY